VPINCSKKSAQIAKWFTLYAIGILFVVGYSELWKQKNVKPSLTSGDLLGATSGLVGIIGWKAMFEAHPNPPAKNLKRFFGHLMLAHIIFGIFSALAYKSNLAHKDS